MWFERALHKEKITHMFGDVFELKDAQLNGFYFHETSSIRFLFSIKGIPQKHPQKWDGNGYNAMNIVLGFDGVKNFNANCCKVNFICNPDIHSSQGKSTISIKARWALSFVNRSF